MHTGRGVRTRPVESERDTEPSALADAASVALVGRRPSNRRNPMAISVSTRPMTPNEEASAAEALTGLVARLVRGRLQQRRENHVP